jgi:hypothetical protein
MVGEARPDPHILYRCHVCRLDLRFDAVTGSMAVTPFEFDPLVNPSQITPAMAPPKPK